MTRKTLRGAACLLAAGSMGIATAAAADKAPQLTLPKPDGKPADMTKPVMVFILMGQADMVGMGKAMTDLLKKLA